MIDWLRIMGDGTVKQGTAYTTLRYADSKSFESDTFPIQPGDWHGQLACLHYPDGTWIAGFIGYVATDSTGVPITVMLHEDMTYDPATGRFSFSDEQIVPWKAIKRVEPLARPGDKIALPWRDYWIDPDGNVGKCLYG